MSDKVNIQTTEFKNVPSGSVTRGVRVYDEQHSVYDNSWESIPQDDIEILEMLLELHPCRFGSRDEISQLMNDVSTMETGVIINGEEYEWDEISDLFE